MARCTIDEFYQEFKDFKEYQTDTLNKTFDSFQKTLTSIEEQTKKTNGRVNKHDTDLAIVTERYDTCPARELNLTPNKSSRRSNLIACLAVLLVLVEVILSITGVL